jgi:hypothetical protein
LCDLIHEMRGKGILDTRTLLKKPWIYCMMLKVRENMCSSESAYFQKLQKKVATSFSQLGIGIEANAASSGIPASSISVRYRSNPILDWGTLIPKKGAA